jgi:hypothetical protein
VTAFDRIIIVDWSASKSPSPKKPSADAIWIAVHQAGTTTCTYHRTRLDAVTALCAQFDDALALGQRVMAGFDFPFGYPAGFAHAVTGRADPLSLWAELAARIVDGADNANNRFDVACGLNRMFPGVGPFWGCPQAQSDADLPAKGSLRHGHGMAERRKVEEVIPSAQPTPLDRSDRRRCWALPGCRLCACAMARPCRSARFRPLTHPLCWQKYTHPCWPKTSLRAKAWTRSRIAHKCAFWRTLLQACRRTH